MGEWRTQVLEKLVEEAGGVIRTGPFGSQLHANEYAEDPSGVPVVMPKDMIDGRISHRSVSRVNAVTAERLGSHCMAAGDLVLARRGDVGRLASVAPNETGWICGTGSIRIHAPKHDVLDPQFLRYAMSNPSVTEWLVGQAVGATMPNLNAKIVAAVPIAAPGPRIQRRVAGVLSAIDELIEVNERRIVLLEDLARSLYREWFVHFRFPGHEDVGFVDSELGPIPEGWEARPLSDVVTTQYGLTASASKEAVGPKLLRGMDINKRSFVNWEEVPFCSAEEDDVEKFGVDVGDVLVVRMADPGKVGIVERPVEAVFASYLVRLRSVNPLVPPYFLFHFLDSPRYQTRIRGSSTGSTRKSASAAVLTEPVMAIPTSDIATRFESKVGPLRSALASLVDQSAALRRIRDLLLPRLVTGQLDISDIDLGVLTPAETE